MSAIIYFTLKKFPNSMYDSNMRFVSYNNNYIIK